MEKRKNKWLILFLAPYTIGAFVFILYPLFYSLYLSFTNQNLFGGGKFIGIKNFEYCFTNTIFQKSLGNTAYYALLVVPLEVGIALFFALQLYKSDFFGARFFRSVTFMPYVFSLVSIGLVWSWLFSPGFGFLSQVCSLFKWEFPSFLSDTKLAMPGVAIATLWRNIGYYTTIFIAGLQGVPMDLLEAAKIDGANSRQLFRYITFPMVSPTVFFSLVVATIWAFQVFDLTYTMTKGGPARATLSTGLHIYNTAFQDNNIGRASAMSWILLLIILILTGFYFLGQRRWVYYENE